jgi:glutamine amidotransferase
VQCFGRRGYKRLGYFDIDVIKFTTKVKVPQMGWNQIYNLKSPLFDGIAENEYMYLVHSFSICAEAIAITNYEVEYASALQRIIFTEPSFTLKKR